MKVVRYMKKEEGYDIRRMKTKTRRKKKERENLWKRGTCRKFKKMTKRREMKIKLVGKEGEREWMKKYLGKKDNSKKRSEEK